MKPLIEKWRARAAVEGRQSIAEVYLECAQALEDACGERIRRLAIAARISDEALDREIMRDCYEFDVAANPASTPSSKL